MSKLQMILIFLYISGYYSKYYCEKASESEANEKDCRKRIYADEDGDGWAPYYECCYLKAVYNNSGKTSTRTGCVALTSDQYHNLEDYIEFAIDSVSEFENKLEKLDILCESSYVKFGLFLLMPFLFYIYEN